MARPRTTSDADILAATARMIGTHGIAKLTLAVVAREAGLAPATLVQRFGSKRGLLLALSAAAADQVEPEFAKVRASEPAPIAALYAVLTGMAGHFSDRAEFARHLTFLQMDIADPQFQALASAHAGALRREIRSLVEAAVQAGELVDEVDPDRLARSIQITFNGSLIVWALAGDHDQDRQPAQALSQDLTDLLAPYRPAAGRQARQGTRSEPRPETTSPGGEQ